MFAVLCAGVIAEGDADDESFSERACDLQISIQSSLPSIACDGCRVSCTLHLSQIFVRRGFFPRDSNYFFGRCFIFENAKHFIRDNSRFNHVLEFEDIYFSSERVKIYYSLPCGQHVADSVDIKEFIEFIEFYGETEEK